MKKTKFISIMIPALMISGFFTGCACKHENWNDATCTTPKTCEVSFKQIEKLVKAVRK